MIGDSSRHVERYCGFDSFIVLILSGSEKLALENAALRQRLAVFKRSVPRPKLNNCDYFGSTCT
jgi:hypothetical protein